LDDVSQFVSLCMPVMLPKVTDKEDIKNCLAFTLVNQTSQNFQLSL